MISIPAWIKFGLAALAAIVLSYNVGSCTGHRTGYAEGKAVMEKAIADANAKALEQKNRADALAAAQRITDAIAVSTREKELRDAIASTPDTAPDAVRIALGCERLRRANGGNSANLPAVCRPGGGAQARPAT